MHDKTWKINRILLYKLAVSKYNYLFGQLFIHIFLFVIKLLGNNFSETVL